MSQETVSPGSWRLHLVLTGGVLFTVLLALLLAQLDSLQRQILPSPVAAAITNLNATATNTPLPAIPLASGTPMPPTALANAADDTAVAVLPRCNAAPPGWVLTPVNAGDTLLGFSVQFNISEEKIRLANCLQPGDLLTMTALYLPSLAASPAPTAVCGPPANWQRYTVRRGDTMFKLSLQFGTTITAILNANCLTSTNLQAGQIIFLPPLSVVPPSATAMPSPTGTATNTVTATATGSSTPTTTRTAPPLPTSSVTATSTASVTSTPTGTGTTSATPTGTPSSTPTSPAGTVTSTATATSSATSTSSATPSASATPLPTDTASPTNTAVPTSTPTDTAVPTETPTATTGP